jgi:hypothetical protein
MNTTKSEISDAIALAKAVRQTALANAKVALEEQFNDKYQALFAIKLKNESATSAPMEDESVVGEADIDSLIKELESDIEGSTGEPVGGGEESPAPEGPTAPTGAAPAVATPAPEGTTAPEGTPVVQAPVIVVAAPSAGMGAEPTGDMGAEPELPPSEPNGAGAGMDEELDLDELLESLKKEIASEDDEEKEKLDEDTKLKSSGIGGKTGGSNKPASAASSSSKLESGGVTDNGMPESTVEAKDATTAKRPNVAKNATPTNLSTPKLGGTSGPALKAARPNSGGDFESTAKLTEANKTINEQSNAITFLKNELNEINLLNAKLLYTNKLFKEHSINGEQKLRIVEMFDLSRNIREVKQTFANYADALSFSATSTPKKVTAKSVSPARVAAITEGLATSKQVVTEKQTKEIISENALSRSRFQELAGIKIVNK